MRLGRRALFALALGFVAVGCDSEPEAAPCDVEAKLSSIDEHYFKVSCVFDSCHDNRRPEADLDFELTGQALRDALVGVPVDDENASMRGKIRVIPGDPDNSFLVQKLEGTMAADEGELMPDGVTEPIGEMCEIAMIRQWILDGAPNN